LNDPSSSRVLTASTAPVFFSFFLWGFGTGAQHLARPLFAYALTGDVFLVSLLISLNALPRIIVGPVTGMLTDRIGRKPMSIIGASLRGVTNIAQIFAGDYTTFLALEFTGQIGVSMWGTSSNVLVADMTTTRNRARVIAVRGMARRSGFILGPLIGGVLAATYGFDALFLLNGLSKFVIVFVVVFFVAETRSWRTPAPSPESPVAGSAEPIGSAEPTDSVEPEASQPAGRQPARAPKPWIASMKTPSFVALIIVMTGMSMSQTAVIQTLLPLHAQETLGIEEDRIGFLLAMVAVTGFLIAFPSGMMSDRFGRKVTLVPGLLMMSLASIMLAIGGGYAWLLLVVVIKGAGDTMTMGTASVYAMDLAPAEGRGAFLGVVQMFQAGGAFAGPLLIGGLYHAIGPEVAFGAVAGLLGVGSLAMAVLGRETAGPRGRPAETAVTAGRGDPEG
jgi:MFS family permease